jgi:Ca2+-binding RTX toxin-like protein
MPDDYVRGTAGDDDIRSTGNGAYVVTGAGDDVLRGGRADDILVGGAGNDQLWGGGGADQFRFFGDQIEGTSDTDRIYDLNFSEGDTLVFGKFDGAFHDGAGVNEFNNGSAAIISSYLGLQNAQALSGGKITIVADVKTDLLFVSIDNGHGAIETLRISHAAAGYIAAGQTPA